MGKALKVALLEALRNSDSHGDGSADHGVVAHAQEAHHLDVRGNGGGACELRVGMHTAHGIGHAVGSRACRDVIRMEGTACAAAGSNGEVLLAVLKCPLLVGTCNKVLEAGRVGGVAGDGNINALELHDGDAFENVVSAVAADLCALAVGISYLADDLELAGEEIEFGLNISETVDSGDDVSSVLAETVEDNAELVGTNLVSHLSDLDSTLSSSVRLVTSKECEALCLLTEKTSCKVSVAKTNLTIISN